MKLKESNIIKIAKALNDRTRIKLLQEIASKGTITCTDALSIAKLSQPTVSHHINLLINSGLVNAKKDGRHLILSINKEYFNSFSDFLKNIYSPNISL